MSKKKLYRVAVIVSVILVRVSYIYVGKFS